MNPVRLLRITLPLATLILALCLFPGDAPPPAPVAQGDRSRLAPSDAAPESTDATRPTRTRADLPSAYSGEILGDSADLTGPARAAFLRQGLPPRGRQYRIARFPDLRRLREGDPFTLPLPDGRLLSGTVNWSKPDPAYRDTHHVAIGFDGDSGGLVASHDGPADQLAGTLLLEGEAIAWRIRQDDEGHRWLDQHLRADLICEPETLAASRSRPLPGDPSVPASSATAPTLNSRPEAPAVIYLDFDGEPTTTYADWPRNAPGSIAIAVPHSGFTAEQMTRIWRRVAEDFAPFNINVTTEAARYAASITQPGRSMRCLVSATLPASVGGAGLAIVGSFAAGSGLASNVPCWVEVSAYALGTPPTDSQLSSLANNISHEIGHTLGLIHDGDSTVSPPTEVLAQYYQGHGSAPMDWSPIMGYAYAPGGGASSRNILQWSRGDYPGADNPQDDLAIISGPANGFGYAPDESTGRITSQDLTATGNREVGGEGVISRAADADWWSFEVGEEGVTTVIVEPADRATSLPNLDCRFHIEDAAGNDVSGTIAFQDNLSASHSLLLPAGIYHVVVSGSGNRQFPDKTGYDSYGSIGRYLVTVDLPFSAAIEPWADNSTIFNLDGLQVHSPQAASVSFILRREDPELYWTGTNWSSTLTYLPAVPVSGKWRPDFPLPDRSNWPADKSLTIFASVADATGNTTGSQILVSRTPADGTSPQVVVQSPTDGSILTGPGLPTLQGYAADPESGIASVTLSLARFAPGGIEFWNGSAWTSSTASLPAVHDPQTDTWTAAGWPLPSGADWANLNHTLQATATNRETPAAVTSTAVNFIVDYHPTYTWTGATLRDGFSENDSTAWDTAQNWDPVGIPGPGDIAVISNGDTVTTLTAPAVHGLRLSAGTLQLGGFTLTTTGRSEWNGGSLTGLWENTGTLTLGGGGRQLNTSARLRNAGTVIWFSGVTTGFDSATVTNLPGATWILDGAGDVFSQVYGGNEFINQGHFRHITGADVELNDWTYRFSGEIEKSGGTIHQNAPCTVMPSTVFSGAGNFRIIGGTTNLDGPVATPAGLFEVAGGTLQTGTPAILDGHYRWSGGTWNGHFTLTQGSHLGLTGNCRLATSSVLNNQGTVEWNSTSPLEGFDSATVTNQPTGLWRFATTGNAFSSVFGGNVFTNLGTLEATGGSADLLLGASWTYHLAGSFTASTPVARSARIGSDCHLHSGASFHGPGGFAFSSTTHLKGPVTFSAPSRVTGGTFTGEAAGLIHGSLDWLGGSFSGITRVAAGARLRITGVGSSERILNTSAAIDVAGTLVWGSNGLNGFDSGLITIRGGALFQISGASTFSSTYGGNRLVVESGAVVEKANGGISSITWAVENAGSIVVRTGILDLAGGGTSSGSFTTDVGGFLRFSQGSHLLSTGATLAGAVEITGGSLVASGNAGGSIAVNGGTLGSTGSAVFSFASTSTWTAGSLTGNARIPAGASLTLSGSSAKQLDTGATLVTEGLLQWSGGAPVTGFDSGTLDIRSGGTFRLTADGDLLASVYGGNRLLLAGTFEKTGGSGITRLPQWTLQGAGTWRPITGNLQIEGPVDLLPGSSFEGPGRTRFVSGTVSARGIATIATGSTLELAGATLGGHADQSATFQGGAFDWSAGQINGRVTLGSNSVLTGSAQKMLGTSAEIHNTAVLTLGGSGNLVGFDTATLRNLPAATLTLAGSPISQVYGGNRLINEGTLVLGPPPVRQSIPWQFQQGSTGIVRIDLAGPDAATPEFDILHATGGIQLAGTLEVSKTGPYQPAAGTPFEFLTGSPLTGSFATVLAPGFDIEYAANSATLRATAAGLTFADWAEDQELEGPDALPEADPDHDGLVNFLEYAFNSDPNAPGASPVSSGLLEHSGNTWLVVRYRRWQDRIDAGVAYQPQASPDLGEWDGAGILDETDPDAPLVPGSEARRCLIPVGGSDRFLRLEVE